MMLTPIQKQILRENLLLQLEKRRNGLPFETLALGAKFGGFKEPLEVERALDWLIEKGYAIETRAEYSDIIRIWKISDAGLEFLDR